MPTLNENIIMEIYTISMAGVADGNVCLEAKEKGATVGILSTRTLHPPSSFEHYHFLSSSYYSYSSSYYYYYYYVL